jgi:hypothetical protein
MDGTGRQRDGQATSDRRPADLRSVRLTARGAAACGVLLALGLAAAITGQSGLLPFVGVVGLPLLAAPFLILGRAGRAGAAQVRSMVTPPLVPVGGHGDLIVQLANEGDRDLPPLGLEGPAEHWATATTVEKPPGTTSRWRGGWAPDPARLIRWGAIAGGHSGTVTVPLPTSRRGVFAIGPLQVWVHDPFGLLARPVTAAPAVTLVVHPAPARAAPPLPTVPQRASAGGGGIGEVDQDDPSGELSGLRPYVAGDRLHLLSWSVEARYGTLMVQQFRPEGQARLGLVLDDRAGVHRQAAFEAALSLMHALAAAASDRALDMEITTLTGSHVVVPATPEGMVEFLTFLARARPRPVSPGASDPVSSPASAVVTTATARASLSRWPGDLPVLVAE